MHIWYQINTKVYSSLLEDFADAYCQLSCGQTDTQTDTHGDHNIVSRPRPRDVLRLAITAFSQHMSCAHDVLFSMAIYNPHTLNALCRV